MANVLQTLNAGEVKLLMGIFEKLSSSGDQYALRMETDLLGKKVNTFLTYIRNCDPVSVVGYPAITVPAGYSSEGLPIRLQLVARPWEENKLLAIANDFEQVTKVRKAPKL